MHGSSAAATAVTYLVVSMLAANVGRALRRARTLEQRVGAVAALGGAGAVALIGFTGSTGLLSGVRVDTGLLAVVIALIIVNGTFYFLMGASTPIGRRTMDKIAGLKQYLVLAEQDRMNMRAAPQMSPRHFETLLPYAVALGVEKPWSEAFAHWLAAAGSTQAAFDSRDFEWYDAPGPGSKAGSSALGGLGSSLAGRFTISLPVAKASSSGFSGSGGSGGASRGGFSGGGSGGGGGGGW